MAPLRGGVLQGLTVPPAADPGRGKALWGAVALAACALGAAYVGVLASLARAWTYRNDYSHGFIVPLVSLYFVWAARRSLRSCAVRPRVLWGSVVVGIACLLLLLGEAASVEAVQQVSLMVAIPGAVLLVLGWDYLKALALPIAYLGFMIPPLFDAVTEPMHWPFQLYSAAVAASMLRVLGVPVLHTAQFLELPGTTLEVARACSGIRFLVSIVALSVPLAYMTQRRTWRRAGLIGAAVLIGVGLNPIRITFIGLWAQWGGEVLHGPGHIFQGLFVSVLGFCILFVLALAFSEGGPATQADPGAVATPPTAPWRRVAFALSAAVLLLGGTGVWVRREPGAVRLRAPLAGMPATLGAWTWVPGPAGAGFLITGADESVDRAYRDRSGFAARVQVGYYSRQRQGKELVSYHLEQIYRNARVQRIGDGASGLEASVADLPAPGGRRRLVLLWHEIAGRAVASASQARAQAAVGWLFRGRNDGAVFIVSAETGGAADTAPALAKLADLARLAHASVPIK